MWAMHSPQTPLLLKVPVVVVEQRQDDKGPGGAGLLAWARSPLGSPALRIEQTPMMDSVRFRDPTQSRWAVIQVQEPFTFRDANAHARCPGPPARNQDTKGDTLVMRFPDEGET